MGDKKMQAWEKLQGIQRPKKIVAEKRIGWLPEGVKCSRCMKSVMDKGGVYCGRQPRGKGLLRGNMLEVHEQGPQGRHWVHPHVQGRVLVARTPSVVDARKVHERSGQETVLWRERR